jgi:hypothetical protein
MPRRALFLLVTNGKKRLRERMTALNQLGMTSLRRT